MSDIRNQVLACRAASQSLAQLSSAAKTVLLQRMADHLDADRAVVLAANRIDVDAAIGKGTSGALLDRLQLDAARIDGIVCALREVAELPDPVGQVTCDDVRPNGIRVQRVRVPLGVIAMIYEARPNVTADAAALCIKAGNGVVLRGGSEALQSNTAITASLQRALTEHGLDAAALTLVTDLRRETMVELLQLSDLIDLAIPRGGEGLIRFVAEHARVPVIKHYKGVCHLYVDASADIEVARGLLVDGKTTRPSACNSLETLLVHVDCANEFLPKAGADLLDRKVEIRGCDRTRALLSQALVATDADYAAEFLDAIIAVRVVDSLDDAIAHIRRYSSDHTEVIATSDPDAATHFVDSLRSAVLMVNASSRFSDGGELGLGAEIGISTTRLHAYGPMGLEALTIERYVVRGDGQVRHPR